MSNQMAWLITGAATGLGRAMTLQALGEHDRAALASRVVLNRPETEPQHAAIALSTGARRGDAK